MAALIETSEQISGATPMAMGGRTRVIVCTTLGDVTLSTFFAQVRGLAAQLPAGRHAINLCEDRYRFLLALCAAAVRGQVTLLPPSRAPAVVEEVRARYPESYCLGDGAFAPPPDYWRLPEVMHECDGAMPSLHDDTLVAIGFTSGSTGAPKPNPKTWGSFRASTAQNIAALRDLWQAHETLHLVATVPPQHMYGMEMSVLLPLLGNAAVHASRPLFPEDVARALRETQAPRLLVTTPVHLRALLQSGIALPPLVGIISATAPLPPAVAIAAEAQFGCEVRELFGSTETCVIARRRTAVENAWTLLPGVRLAPQSDGTLVHAAHLATPVALADVVELQGDHTFHLRGRNTDLLEIAGKRASLGDLTSKLLAIDGVIDGVVFQQDDVDASGVRRIAALVVAPGLSDDQILLQLRASIDPVFLPRPLRRVDVLPRNESGKLPRHALQALLRGGVQ